MTVRPSGSWSSYRISSSPHRGVSQAEHLARHNLLDCTIQEVDITLRSGSFDDIADVQVGTIEYIKG